MKVSKAGQLSLTSNRDMAPQFWVSGTQKGDLQSNFVFSLHVHTSLWTGAPPGPKKPSNVRAVSQFEGSDVA